MRTVKFPVLLLLIFFSFAATTASGLSPDMDTEIDTQLGIQPEENPTRSDPTVLDDRL